MQNLLEHFEIKFGVEMFFGMWNLKCVNLPLLMSLPPSCGCGSLCESTAGQSASSTFYAPYPTGEDTLPETRQLCVLPLRL